MEEDTLLVCRKTGKTGEDSNPAKKQHSILLQGLEDSKGYINGIISTIILLDTFAVTLHEGCRLSSLRHEHHECD